MYASMSDTAKPILIEAAIDVIKGGSFEAISSD